MNQNNDWLQWVGGLTRRDPVALNGVMEINILYFDWDLGYKGWVYIFFKTQPVEHLKELCILPHA